MAHERRMEAASRGGSDARTDHHRDQRSTDRDHRRRFVRDRDRRSDRANRSARRARASQRQAGEPSPVAREDDADAAETSACARIAVHARAGGLAIVRAAAVYVAITHVATAIVAIADATRCTVIVHLTTA